MKRVLITGCNMHVKDIIVQMRQNVDKEELFVVGTNCDENGLLRTEVDASHVVPRVTDDTYFDTLVGLCKAYKIDVVLPFATPELPYAADYKDALEAMTGAKVSVTSKESLKAAGKIELMKRFPDLMPMQTVARSSYDVRKFAKWILYPQNKMCCKLANKAGGLGFVVIDDEKAYDLTKYNKYGCNTYMTLDMLCSIVDRMDEEVILQMFEEGIDYSMNVLADHGKLVYGLGFEAPVMSYGAAMVAKIKQSKSALNIAEGILEELKLDGNACFDFIESTDGTLSLLEINPRISASLAFIGRAGLDLAYLRVKQLMGENIDDYGSDIDYSLEMRKTYKSDYLTNGGK